MPGTACTQALQQAPPAWHSLAAGLLPASTWWASSGGAGRTVENRRHPQSCRQAAASSMHAYVPNECSGYDLIAATQCLTRRKVGRVVFLGDSVTEQLVHTIHCEAGNTTHGTAYRPSDTVLWREPQHNYSLERSAFGDIDFLSLGNKAGGNKVDEAAAAIRSALDQGVLDGGNGTLWVVNIGLHHLLCPQGAAESSCAASAQLHEQRRTEYSRGLATLLEVLAERTSGPLIWRDTTAVHKELLAKSTDVGAATLRKYAHFDDAGVQKLNAAASAAVARFAPRVAHLRYVHDATAVRPDGTANYPAKSDSRHYGADVLQTVLQLHYLCWCQVGVCVRPPVGQRPMAGNIGFRKRAIRS